MAKTLDTLTLDLEDNEDVADMFAGATAGDTLAVTMQGTVNEVTDTTISISVDGVDSVDVDEDDLGEEEDMEVEEEEEEEEEEDIGEDL